MNNFLKEIIKCLKLKLVKTINKVSSTKEQTKRRRKKERKKKSKQERKLSL